MTLLAMAGFMPAISSQEVVTPDPSVWYRIVSMYNGTDARLDRCIQYFPEGSAHPGLIWSADQLPDSDPASDYQYWRFEPSPDNDGQYAIICKAAPDGYLSDDPTSFDAQGRWRYVADVPDGTPVTDKYGFEFGAIKAGVDEVTGEGYADIYTDYTSAEHFRYLNCAGASEDYAINVGRATAPQGSNEWLFRFAPKKQISAVEEISFESAATINGDGSGEIYDLYGRRVVNPGPGLYIINGEKVIVH